MFLYTCYLFQSVFKHLSLFQSMKMETLVQFYLRCRKDKSFSLVKVAPVFCFAADHIIFFSPSTSSNVFIFT